MMTANIKRRLLDVDEYNRMFDAEILTERDKVELINGEILEMSPIGKKHAALVDWINNHLAYRLYSKAIVRVQSPIMANDFSEPEPDIAILRWKADFYQYQTPQVKDIILIIEVADSSLAFDREVKLPLYAAAGISNYWIVNIPDQSVEVYQNPEGENYSYKEVLNIGGQVKVPGFEISIKLEEIF